MLFVYLLVKGACAQPSTVTMIIDGDHIVLSDGQKIKLMGIDAPEKHPSVKLSRDALISGRSEALVVHQGELAANYLVEIAGGNPVMLAGFEALNATGYLPALVYVTDQRGQPLYCLNQKMIEAGFAVADATYDTAEAQLYARLEKIARTSGHGLWAESMIMVEPHKARSHTADPVVFNGKCARDAACVWVSGGGLLFDAGMWASRPGRKCACAPK